MTVSLVDAVISLFPKTWEQRHNRVRWVTLSQRLTELTRDDWQAYNRLLDSLERNDYVGFCQLVRELNPEGIMSWSLTVKGTKADARDVFSKAHAEQGAYTHEPHKTVMDQIASFAADVAEALPEGMETTLNSYGHMNDDGTGSCTASLGFGKPVVTE